MKIIEVLKEREKDLGKRYSNWNEYEKLKFIVDYDIDGFHVNVEQLLSELNEEVTNIKQSMSSLESNPKLERYVSVNQLINFMVQDFHRNVWKNGLKQLRKIIPVAPEGLGGTCFSSNYSWGNVNLKKGPDYVKGEIIYYWDIMRCRLNFKIVKQHGMCAFISDDLHFDVQRLISTTIDFSDLYDYYTNQEFAYTSYELNSKHFSEPDMDSASDIPLTMTNQQIKIGYINTFYIDCSFKDKEIIIEEKKYNNYTDFGERLQNLYIVDPHFLDNVKVRYEDLPSYVQKKILEYPQQNNNSKSLIRKWISGLKK